MSQKISIVDAFATKPFSGNPAAVCVLNEEQSEAWMQSVAAEMNLSETAFLIPVADQWRLRWFTPKVEVKLCGHATLASAHVLWSEGHLARSQPAVFQTLSGQLTARQLGSEIELDFPLRSIRPAIATTDLMDAIQARPIAVFETDEDLIVELENESAVRRLQPDFGRIERLPPRGVIVTAAATTPGLDFVSRFFVPKAGINEDPVTGSAHCCLAPLWQSRLGKTELRAYQASQRGGAVNIRLAGSRVFLSGIAVTVLKGTLYAEC